MREPVITAGWLTECEHGWLTECEHGWLTECESPLIDPSLLLWVTPHCSCGSQVNGCFDAGMAYVSLSRVRTLGGLRFQKHCPNSLDCDGCAACACSLTPHAVRAHPEVKAFYAMSHELSATAAAFAERLEEAVAAAPTVPAPTIPAPTDPALASPSDPNASLPLPLQIVPRPLLCELSPPLPLLPLLAEAEKAAACELRACVCE